jgi:predicted AlkP superfamily pyrophosphatase or phosphodiesterase
MTKRFAVLLSIPGLRAADLASMPRLSALGKGGVTAPLAHTFPCVTCVSQVTLTTGVTPDKHGVFANGFFWRDRGEVEMWTAWNSTVEAPQNLDASAEARPAVDVGGLVSPLDQGGGRRFHLHSRADPQSGRFRIPLVLHKAD